MFHNVCYFHWWWYADDITNFLARHFWLNYCDISTTKLPDNYLISFTTSRFLGLRVMWALIYLTQIRRTRCWVENHSLLNSWELEKGFSSSSITFIFSLFSSALDKSRKLQICWDRTYFYLMFLLIFVWQQTSKVTHPCQTSSF